MSLLSPNQLCVLLSAQSLSAQLFSGRFQPRIVQQQHARFASTENAIEQLDTLLASLKLPANTQLKISLASECVRYLTLPAQQIYTKKSEKNAYAKAFYHEVYGERMQDWEIRQDDVPPHLPAISVAIDQQVLENIKQLAAKYQLKLHTVEPYVMTAVNFLKKDIGQTSGYLAIVEPQRLLLLHLQKGQVMHLKSEAIQQAWQATLHHMLLRETLLSDEAHMQKPSAEASLLVFAPNNNSHFPQNIADFAVKIIGQQSPARQETDYAMMAALT